MLDFAISSPGPANDALGTCERSSLGSLSTWGADASAVPPYRNSSSSSIVDASAALDMTRLLGRLLARNERTWSRSRVFRSCQLRRCAAVHGWPSRARIGHKQLVLTYIPFRVSESGHVGKPPCPNPGRRRGDRKESLPSCLEPTPLCPSKTVENHGVGYVWKPISCIYEPPSRSQNGYVMLSCQAHTLDS